MGLFTSLKKLFSKSSKVSILVVGLDNSGKSTLINYLKPAPQKQLDIAPTVGFSTEEFSVLGMKVTCFDMSGQGKYRNLWEDYYKQVNAIIFVVDASDKLRLAVAKEELRILLEGLENSKFGSRSASSLSNSGPSSVKNQNKNQNKFTILFLANKMDKPGSASAIECADIMELNSLLNNVEWRIDETDCLTGLGVDEAVKWLAENIKSQGKMV